MSDGQRPNPPGFRPASSRAPIPKADARQPDARALGIINGQRDASGNLTGGIHEATGQAVTVSGGRLQPAGPVNDAWKAQQATTSQPAAPKTFPGVFPGTERLDGTGKLVGGVDQHTGEQLSLNESGQLRGDGKPNVALVQQLQQQAARPAPAAAPAAPAAAPDAWAQAFGAPGGTAAHPDTQIGPPVVPTYGKISQRELPPSEQPAAQIGAIGTTVVPNELKVPGFVTTAPNNSADPTTSPGYTGIVANGVPQVKDANGNFVGTFTPPVVPPAVSTPIPATGTNSPILSPTVRAALTAAGGATPLVPPTVPTDIAAPTSPDPGDTASKGTDSPAFSTGVRGAITAAAGAAPFQPPAVPPTTAAESGLAARQAVGNAVNSAGGMLNRASSAVGNLVGGTVDAVNSFVTGSPGSATGDAKAFAPSTGEPADMYASKPPTVPTPDQLTGQVRTALSGLSPLPTFTPPKLPNPTATDPAASTAPAASGGPSQAALHGGYAATGTPTAPTIPKLPNPDDDDEEKRLAAAA